MVIVLVIVVFVFCFEILNIINKNKQQYVIYDGMMLALSLDGSSITSFPERGAYNIEIDCGDTAKGKWLAEEWKLAIEDITGNVKCNIDFTTNPLTLKSRVEFENQTNNNGNRYVGKNPDNWLWFNKEKWRIIGSVPTTLADGTEINLVKIIRSKSLGTLAFNSTDSVVTWGDNSLYTLLNEKYYGKSDATGLTPCFSKGTTIGALCNYVQVGISDSSTDYYGRMLKDVYWNVGKSNTSSDLSTVYSDEIGTKSSITGKVGLINASDWAYAAEGTPDSKRLNSYFWSWLDCGFGWTITPYGNSTLIIVDYGGHIMTRSAEFGYSVHPVVYLDPSVYIVSGDGTEGNPYQIAM